MVQLSKISTGPKSSVNKEKIKEELASMLEQIQLYQRMMFAEGNHSILLILQGMDAAGKDGVVKDLFSCVNPLGCDVTSFRKPTSEEAGHDFLRRVHKHVPTKGMIQIFNRSHYEDVLVPTVEGYGSKKDMEKRCEHINNFERLLEDNNTKIIKCYLHVSKEEQKERLEERLKLPRKFWKHNDNDWSSREKWDKYMKTYEMLFDKCNDVEWNIIPSDKNRRKVYCIAKKLIEAFESMKLSWPDLDSDLFDPIKDQQQEQEQK